jgi:two-component system cell cycle response regulator
MMVEESTRHEEDGLQEALPEEEEATGAIRITEVQPVNPALMQRDRATLTVLTGPETGRVIGLDKEIVFGRTKEAGVLIDDTSVSRTHARIVPKGDLRWVIEDMKSRNGTFVNGYSVRSQKLSDGDQIQLGASVRFRFAITNVEEEGVLRRMYEASVRDGLTGAFNRKHFNERMETEISYAVRHGTELALVMFDIDHFKRINDEYGHLAGDKVLTKLTAVIHHTVRAEDIFARYGGEEFAVIARGIHLQGTLALGERIRGIAERVVVPFEGLSLNITVSVGVAVLSGLESKSARALISAADAALYRAKQGGRNRVLGP